MFNLGTPWPGKLTGKIDHRNILHFKLFFFLGLHLQHVEVPRLGSESKLQLPAYTTATAMQDP